jgi:hypothetical protein
VAADELTKALLVEEVAAPRAVAEALFASVEGGVPLLQALVDAGAATPDVLSRYLARTETPFLRQVVAVPELVDRLPRGLCARLLALPVRQDAITGTVDVVVADPADPHPAAEIAFHLDAPVRVIRAPLGAIEEALRRLRMHAHEERPPDRLQEAASRSISGQGDDERVYDSRPRGDAGRHTEPPLTAPMSAPPPSFGVRRGSLPPPEPALWGSVPSTNDVPPRRGGLVIDTDSAPPPAVPLPAPRIRTPPWGTPIHVLRPPPTEPPQSGYGSEIPIPLTRKAFGPVSGGTQRPPAMIDPRVSALGEGYAFDTTGFRDVVEKTASPRIETAAPTPRAGVSVPGSASFIPGPPPLPGVGPYAAFAPQLPPPEMGGVLAALRNVGARDEVLELVLAGARMVALKVALFVVKKGGYLGWVSTPEFAERTALQTILVPLDVNSIFDRAVREDLYLGPIRYDEVHAPLLRVMRNPSRDVAAVPIRVSGKTAVIILADELSDTMLATRRLEELAKAAGEAFGRIVRTRR